MGMKSKVLVGILGAAAAGVVIGLLIAPEKGADMRDRIKRKAGGWVDTLSDLFSNAKGEIEEMQGKARQAKSAAEEKVNKMKESFS
jgi:gas vesicle protein